MSDTSAGLSQIEFEVHEEPPHGWVAHCHQFEGYTAVADTEEELMQMCREGVEFVTGRPSSEFTLIFIEGSGWHD
jgi:predicted RNase H-like HicB family nuclease